MFMLLIAPGRGYRISVLLSASDTETMFYNAGKEGFDQLNGATVSIRILLQILKNITVQRLVAVAFSFDE